MSGFEVVLLLLFIVLPLLQALKGKGQEGTRPPGGARPPRPRPGSSRAPGGLRGTVQRGEVERGGAGPASAADMVPDDLWAILTGERRPTLESPPTPEPPVGAAERKEAPLSSTPEHGPGWDPLAYTGPEAVTLETPPPPPEVRHAAFHARMQHAAPSRHGSGASASIRHSLRGKRSLRRAVLLAEVLGPPRGATDL